MPPIELANANGISSRDTSRPDCAAIETTMGNIRATVPVLLTNAPMTAVTSMTSTNIRVSDWPANPISRAPTILARPV